MRHSSAILAVILIAAAVIVGAGTAPASASPSASRSASPGTSVLRIGLLENPDNLNPFIGSQTVSYLLYHLNYDFLVRCDPKTLQPIPGLAERWSHSADGKTWTFTLRKGVTWQDGRAFAAKDVVFTFDLVIDTPMGSYSSYTQGITSVKAVGDYTVRFTTAQPKADILQMWVPIVPQHVWAPIGKTAAAKSFPNSPPVVGTGPFQVVEWKRGQFVRLVANHRYWAGSPKVDQLLFSFYTNPDTLSQDLKSGAIDYAEVDGAAFRSFKSAPGFATHLATAPGYDELAFNCYDKGPSLGNPALRDPAFRRALAWAIDPARIAAIAYSGAATPATSILPSAYYDRALDYHWQPPAAEAYHFNPASGRCIP